MRSLYLYIVLLALCFQSVFSQNGMFTSGGIGSFESGSLLSAGTWFYPQSSTKATYALNYKHSYDGESSLKVDVNTASNWENRIFNLDGNNFNKSANTTYTVSFYMKGTKGNDLEVVLMDGTSNDNASKVTVEIAHSEWRYYSLALPSSSSSASGKIKLTFKNEGLYFLDALLIEEAIKNKWYVSDGNGDNNNDGLTINTAFKTISKAVQSWQAGDIIYVMNGTYTHADYNDANTQTGANVVNLTSQDYGGSVASGNLHGPLVIRNYEGHQPKIVFDGAGGFSGKINYLEISGFEIQGPNQSITYQEAFANRLLQHNYFKGRGIAIWEGHHLNFYNNKVYDCPNSGIRVNNGDYINIAYNEVYNNTWWSSNAESGIVIAQAKSFDNETSKIKMRITNNWVYNNINKIPYYNASYHQPGGRCEYITANSPSDERYGCEFQDYIIDGSGCYVTRNNDIIGASSNNPNGQYQGTFYFANNISYGNGINGLVVHKTDNAIVSNNTIYGNGEVPTDVNQTYSEDWKNNLSKGRQETSGITIHSSQNVKVYNNVSWARYGTDTAYQTFSSGGRNSAVSGNGNLLAFGEAVFPNNVYDTAIDSENLVFDAANQNFKPQENSELIDAGSSFGHLPLFDFEGYERTDGSIDVGAYEYSNYLGVNDSDMHKNAVYPNPFQDVLYLSNIEKGSGLRIVDMTGKIVIEQTVNYNKLDLKRLQPGVYIITLFRGNSKKSLKLIKRAAD